MRKPEPIRSYAGLGALIGIGVGFIIGLIFGQIGNAMFFLGLLGVLIGSFYKRK